MINCSYGKAPGEFTRVPGGVCESVGCGGTFRAWTAEEAEAHYPPPYIKTAIVLAREMIDDWDYEADPHGYCHVRSSVVRFIAQRDCLIVNALVDKIKSMTRIKDLNVTTMDVIVELADGNPGALTAMVALLNDDEFGLFNLLRLDTFEIYGPDIWILYQYVCGGDVAVMRSKLDEGDKSTLKAEIDAA